MDFTLKYYLYYIIRHRAMKVILKSSRQPAFKGPMCGVISRDKRFGNLPLMKSQVGVSTWKDQYQPTHWTVANVLHLSVTHPGGHPTCDVIRGRVPKRVVAANHTTPGGKHGDL